jgi:flagellar M-ring protein FliF
MNKMFGSFNAKWSALTPGRRMAFGLLAALVVVGGYLAYAQTTKTSWGVLYANLDDQTASDVMQKLDADGIPHKLDGNGSRILVPKDQLASTRLTLAGEGITGQPVPPGFDEVFAGQGLATSDFEQQVNYERALEGELARTLLAMEPVQGANVQLSLPERSLYIGTGADDAAKPSASVLLSLDRPLTGREVDTVANLVSSSVEGLTVDAVTIASTDGQLLHAAGTDSSATGSTESLEVTRDYEQALSGRLTELVRIATGSATATVEVRADLDFTSTNTEQETIDPTLNTPTAQHTMTETYEGTGTGAGTVGIDGGPIDTTSGGQGTYNKSDETIEFTPGDRKVVRSTSSAPTVRRLNLAVVVPVPTAAGATPVAPIDPATIQQVVTSAAGIDAARGDSVAIAIVPAIATDDGGLLTTPTEAPVAEPANDLSPIAMGVAAGIVAMGLLMFVLRRRRKRRAKALAAQLSELGTTEQLAEAVDKGTKRGRRRKRRDAKEAQPAVLPVAQRVDQPIADPDRVAVDEIRSDLERMLNESPESLAALLSSWMAK